MEGGGQRRRRGRRREAGREGRKEGSKGWRKEGRNGWTAEGEQRKKKLCELDDMTENLHAKHLKAQCGGVSGIQWSGRVLQPKRPFDVTHSYANSALKSLDPEHIQPLDCWRSAASIKTHQGLFCSISRPLFPRNVTQRHFKKQSYQLLHLYFSLHWNTPLRHNWLLFLFERRRLGNIL